MPADRFRSDRASFSGRERSEPPNLALRTAFRTGRPRSWPSSPGRSKLEIGLFAQLLASMTSCSLAKNGTPRLFYWLLQQRFTGQVHLQDLPQGADAKIYVHEGVPWFTDLAHGPSVLGELLMRRRVITQDQLHQALTSMAQSKQLLGHILVSNGLLSAQQLGQALSLQCSQKLIHLFGFRSGTATMIPQTKLQGLQAGLTQGTNTLALILHGVRKHWDMARMEEIWGGYRGQTLRSTPAFAQYQNHFGLNAQEQALTAELQAGWVLGSPSTPLAQAQLTFALWNCGMVQASAAPAQAAAGGSGASPRRAAPSPRPPSASYARAARPPSSSHRAANLAAQSANQESPPKRVPTARSARPKTDVPIRPKTNRHKDGQSRLTKLPKSMVPGAKNAKMVSPDQARDAFMAKLEHYEGLISREVNAFVLFDLALTASRSDVRKQWNQLSQDFHPDALPKLELEHLHTRAQHVFAHLSNAYQILSSKERRSALKAKLESGIAPGQDTSDFVRQSFESEAMIRDAERLLKKRQYDRAKEKFNQANELRKDQGDVLAGLAWCEFQIAQRNPQAAKAAVDELRKVTQSHPKCANAFYYLGLVHVARQERGPARKALSDAIGINPRLTDAQRQLRALESAPAAAEKPKRKKLFGR